MTNTREARIEISTKCNHKCSFCPLNNEGFCRKMTTMGNSLYVRILNKLEKEASYIEDLTISGMGEPTLDKDYIKKIEIAKNRGYNTYLLSNGSNFKENDVDHIIKNNILDSIRFSLHSLNKNHYREITGSDDLEEVVYNIDLFLEKKAFYNSNMKIIISADIMEEYVEDVSELVSTYKNRVDLLEIWRPHNWINWGSYRKGEKKKSTCGRPLNGPLQIQVDGTINMCCFDYNGDLLLGDFNKQTLNEIFNSEMYKRILDFHSGNYTEDLICSKCDQLFEKDSNIMLYNSKFNIRERINKTSTNYGKLE